MRKIEREVKEEGLALVAFDKTKSAITDKIREIGASVKDFFGSVEQIVRANSMSAKVMVVVDEAASKADEFIEALLFGSMVWVSTDVPLSEEARGIAVSFQGFGQSRLI